MRYCFTCPRMALSCIRTRTHALLLYVLMLYGFTLLTRIAHALLLHLPEYVAELYSVVIQLLQR